MEYYITLDVGGTEVKAGLLNERGELVTEDFESYSSKSEGTKEEILANFAEILQKTAMLAGGDSVKGIGIAFPGPFDFRKGISHIFGLGKYSSLYGVNLREELAARLSDKPPWSLKLFEEMVFLHDMEAFALGECKYGSAKHYPSVFCLCIGTGAGSAYLEEGKIVRRVEGIPENGWIYSLPFKESIIDDYISARGLEALAFSYLQEQISGKELYQLALKGNQQALAAFKEFGEQVKQAVEIALKPFPADMILLGGQITNSFSFWGGALAEYAQKRDIAISLSPNTSLAAFKGLYSVFNTE